MVKTEKNKVYQDWCNMCLSEACSHSDDSKDEYHPILQSMQDE